MATWDPTGVSDLPDAADEYDSFLPAILRELRDGSVETLADYLHFVSTDLIGVPRSRDDDRDTASRLVEWGATQSA
jgi:hypothetical protein